MEIPWPIYSAVHLALTRALNEHLGRWQQLSSLFGPLCFRRPLSVATLQHDHLLSPGGPWTQTCLFYVKGDLHTLPELLDRVERGEETVIALNNIPEIIGNLRDTVLLVQAYLACVFLELRLIADDAEGGAIFRVGGAGPARFQTLRPYFPLSHSFGTMIAPFLRGRAAVLNLCHPFARWLLSVAPTLLQRFPAIFRLMTSELFKVMRSPSDPKGCVDTINASLERLYQLDPYLVKDVERLSNNQFGSVPVSNR